MANPSTRSPKSLTPRSTSVTSVNSNTLSSGLDTKVPRTKPPGSQHLNLAMHLKSSPTSIGPTLTNQDPYLGLLFPGLSTRPCTSLDLHHLRRLLFHGSPS